MVNTHPARIYIYFYDNSGLNEHLRSNVIIRVVIALCRVMSIENELCKEFIRGMMLLIQSTSQRRSLMMFTALKVQRSEESHCDETMHLHELCIAIFPSIAETRQL